VVAAHSVTVLLHIKVRLTVAVERRKPRWRHIYKVLIFDGIAFLSSRLSRCLHGDGIGPPVAQGQKLAVETKAVNDLCID